MRFTPEEALDFAAADRLEDWIHSFLATAEKNEALSSGLKRAQRFWIGPILFELACLKRSCGPEPDAEFFESQPDWDKTIERMRASIAAGWEAPPLIVQYKRDGVLSVRDGNHRLGALVAENVSNYWIIVWFDCSQDRDMFSATVGGAASLSGLCRFINDCCHN